MGVDGGSVIWPLLIGLHPAKELLIGGELLSVETVETDETDDAREAGKAFVEERSPKFKGR